MHRELGRRAREAGVGLLVAVGALADEVAAGFAGDSRTVADAQAAAALVPQLLAPGDTVLVKGSRGVGLEVVCTALRAAQEPGAGGARGDQPAASPGPADLQAQGAASGPR